MSTGEKGASRGTKRDADRATERGTERDTERDADQQMPRMPHERDQSSDSQQGEPREVLEKAYRDVEEGRQDTDRRGAHGYEKPENRILHDKEKAPAPPRDR